MRSRLRQADVPQEAFIAALKVDGHAVYGAIAEWCGLNGKRAFIPLFKTAKDQAKMNARQLYLVSIIYGDFMRRQFDLYRAKGACPADFKERLDAKLPKIGT